MRPARCLGGMSAYRLTWSLNCQHCCRPTFSDRLLKSFCLCKMSVLGNALSPWKQTCCGRIRVLGRHKSNLTPAECLSWSSRIIVINLDPLFNFFFFGGSILVWSCFYVVSGEHSLWIRTVIFMMIKWTLSSCRGEFSSFRDSSWMVKKNVCKGIWPVIKRKLAP